MQRRQDIGLHDCPEGSVLICSASLQTHDALAASASGFRENRHTHMQAKHRRAVGALHVQSMAFKVCNP